MAQLTGGQALVQSLKSYGVDTIFGLPGVQLDNTFDALYDEQDSIRVINTRHEQSTAYMAYGYAASTGKVGVYLVVPGPGLLNTTAALSTAYATNAPVLALSGQVHSQEINKGYGSLHEIPHQLDMIRHLTKWAARIERPADTPGMVREAFRQLRTGRPRPVELEMSPDIMGLAEEVELLEAVNSYPASEADPELVARAAELLANAKNPLIFAGGGAMDAGEPIRELAEVLQAPVIMTPSGRGVVSDRHPLALTMVGGRHVYADADVVLAIGTRFDRPATDWGVPSGPDDAMTIIRVDIDESDIDRIITPDVALVGDARRVTGQIFDQVDRKTYTRPSRLDELNAIREKVEDQLFEFQPSHDFARTLRAELPDDGILSGEITQLSAYADLGFPVYHPRTLIGAGYQGTLGFGFATALGVQVANPDKKVLSVNGDGGFLYTMPELATAVRHKIPLVAVVINDGAFGNVKYIQQTRFGGREIANSLHNPDFVKLAESFGAAGLRATNAEELGRAVREGFANNHPTLIDVPVDRLPPIRMIARGRIRG
jgi:acetolactate synthase-1/2/3 large subunit